MKRTEDGWAEGGLKIHKAATSGWWHVTHLASGRCVDTGIDTRPQAKAIVEALLNTGIDFTRDVGYLELRRQEVVGVLHRMHDELHLPKMDYGTGGDDGRRNE